MLISCEKCATTYVLDEALIPASGVPVQCTRCGHVFTAMKPGSAPTTMMEAVPEPPGASPRGPSSTMMFGAPSVPAPAASHAPAAKPPSSTMMFGAPGAQGAVPPAGGAAKPASSTMMFGVPGAQAPAAPASGAAKPASSTMMFGAPAAQAPASPASKPASTTMMFGAPGAQAPAPPAAKPASTTMMFGAPGAPAPAAPPSPAAKPASTTMMFGAPGAQAPAAPAPAAPKPASTTMMFGAPGAQAPVAPAGPGPQKPASSTMMFGVPTNAAPATPAAKPASTTMMFGAPGAPGAQAAVPPAGPGPQKPASTTMMFGVPGAQAPAAPAAPAGKPASTTMMFGAPGAQAPAAPAAPATKPASTTMMFGAPGAQAAAAPAAKPASTTMMFGAPQVPPAPAASPAPAKASTTMMFGAPAAGSPPTPKLASSTMIFGAPTAAAKPAPVLPKVTAGSVEIRHDLDEVTGTGRTENTVRVDLDSITRGQGEASEEGARADSAGMTPPEGEDAAPARHDRTLLFALHDQGAAAAEQREAPATTPSEGSDAVQDRHNRTQLFAMRSAPDLSAGATIQLQDPPPELREALHHGGPQALELPPELEPAPVAAVEPLLLGTPGDLSTTLPPDALLPSPLLPTGDTDRHQALAPASDAAVTTLPDPMMNEIGHGQPATNPGQPPGLQSTQPNLSPIQLTPPKPLELPPEPAFASAPELLPPSAAQPTSMTAQFEAVSAEIANQGRRRMWLAIGVVVVLLLGVAGFVVSKLVLTRPTALPEAVQTLEGAIGRLRKDDSAAKEESINALTGLIARYPEYAEAKAGLVLALALQYDDLQQRLLRYEAKHKELTAEVARLEKDKPDAWNERRDVFAAQANELKKQHDTLAETASAVHGRLLEADTKLQKAVKDEPEGSPAHIAMLRARAMVKAVAGLNTEAQQLEEAFHRFAPEKTDDWIDLVMPEAVINGPATSENRAQALARIDVVRKRELNSTFLRPYVLAARIHLIGREYEAASNELASVINFDKQHDVALELNEWLQKHPVKH